MITPIEDLEDVVDNSCDLDDDSQLDGAQVIGVHQMEETSTTTGTCQQCATMQKLMKKKLTCKLFIKAGDEHLTVQAYEDVLAAIVEPSESHVKISSAHAHLI